MLERRALLKTGLLGGALLGALGLGISLRPVRRLPGRETPRLSVLSEASFWTLVAVAERVVPADADPVAIATGADVALIALPSDARRDVDTLLSVLENGVVGLLFSGTPAPFSARDAASRDATLADWSRSRLALKRTGYQALRKLCLATYYSSDAAWARAGYPGPPPTGGLYYDDPRAGAS